MSHTYTTNAPLKCFHCFGVTGDVPHSLKIQCTCVYTIERIFIFCTSFNIQHVRQHEFLNGQTMIARYAVCSYVRYECIGDNDLTLILFLSVNTQIDVILCWSSWRKVRTLPLLKAVNVWHYVKKKNGRNS